MTCKYCSHIDVKNLHDSEFYKPIDTEFYMPIDTERHQTKTEQVVVCVARDPFNNPFLCIDVMCDTCHKWMAPLATVILFCPMCGSELINDV